VLSRLVEVMTVAIAVASCGGTADHADAPHTSSTAPAGHFRGESKAAKTSTSGCADTILAKMSLAQQVGQLFIAGVSSSAPTAEQVSLIRTRHLGGAILMGHTDAGVAATAHVSHSLQAQASTHATQGVKLWVAVDQEGGFVQVLNGPGFSAIPTALAQGEVTPATLAVRAQRWAGQLKAAGVNLDLAPVMDTVPADLGTDNAPIGHYDREYGHTPQRVARHGTAVLEGMQRGHVDATAKHFPGLGRVRHNPDTSPVVVDKVTTRHDPYLAPFKAAIDDKVAAVMVSSARYTQIDRHHLGAFSAVIMRDVLRGDLGFTGMIVSDDLGNAAVVQDVPVGARAVRFIRSGGTVVLTVATSTVDQMTQAVLDKATASPTFRARVQADALLVLKTKHRLGLLTCS